MADAYCRALDLDRRFAFLEDPARSVPIDRARAAGDGVLSGLCVGVKSNVAVEGQAQTAGLSGRAAALADADAPLVAKLRASGAHVLSRLTMDAAALGAATEENGLRATDNPAAPGFSVGGSSGGSAAAVACGAVDVAIGTDTLGSVRIPASYCGIFGLKPARGVIPDGGVFPLVPALDTVGLLASDIDPLQQVFSIFAPSRRVLDLRVSLPRQAAEADGATAVTGALTRAKTVLSESGRLGPEINVSHWLPADLRKAAFAVMCVDAASQLRGARDLPTSVEAALGYGAGLGAQTIKTARMTCAQAAAGLHAALEDGTVLLMPTTSEPAFPRGGRPPKGQADFTVIANVADVPALAVPMGRDPKGRPISVQLIGPRGSEWALMELGRALTSASA